MAAKTLRELFVEELRDMYDGEKQLTRALTKVAKASESEELQKAFTRVNRDALLEANDEEHMATKGVGSRIAERRKR